MSMDYLRDFVSSDALTADQMKLIAELVCTAENSDTKRLAKKLIAHIKAEEYRTSAEIKSLTEQVAELTATIAAADKIIAMTDDTYPLFFCKECGRRMIYGSDGSDKSPWMRCPIAHIWIFLDTPELRKAAVDFVHQDVQRSDHGE